jgi:hypothetical protein
LAHWWHAVDVQPSIVAKLIFSEFFTIYFQHLIHFIVFVIANDELQVFGVFGTGSTPVFVTHTPKVPP